MFDTHKPHPLLAQVPLTVSPFLSLPTAVTLPYTFRSVPTSLPPSIVSENGAGKPKYVTSSSGHSAHPDDIVNSCKSLQNHLKQTSEAAEKAVKEWEQDIKDRDLAEKRRVAPGWLDRDEKILEPTKAASKASAEHHLLDGQPANPISAPAMSPSREGEELDRAFGGMGISLYTNIKDNPTTEKAMVLNSSATATEAPRAYFGIAPSTFMSQFLDDPLGSWQTIVLLIICVVAFGSCAAFLAFRYTEVFSLGLYHDFHAPPTLEAQKPKSSGSMANDATHMRYETPVTGSPLSRNYDKAEVRRRPGAKYVRPKWIAMGGVLESKIAQRRASRSGSLGWQTGGQNDNAAAVEQK